VWILTWNTLCNFVSPAVSYCHYACGSTKVTVRSIDVMYRYSPSLPTIYNYHSPALIISILPQNAIAVHHKQKTDTQTVPATVQLHYVLPRKVSWNTDFVRKCRIHRYAYVCFYGLLIYIAESQSIASSRISVLKKSCFIQIHTKELTHSMEENLKNSEQKRKRLFDYRRYVTVTA
jgi:hypothetical protein